MFVRGSSIGWRHYTIYMKQTSLGQISHLPSIVMEIIKKKKKVLKICQDSKVYNTDVLLNFF